MVMFIGFVIALAVQSLISLYLWSIPLHVRLQYFSVITLPWLVHLPPTPYPSLTPATTHSAPAAVEGATNDDDVWHVIGAARGRIRGWRLIFVIIGKNNKYNKPKGTGDTMLQTVGEQVTDKEVEIWGQSLTKDRQVQFAVDKEVRAKPPAEPTKQDQRAPIKMVNGRAWSPGI